MRDQHHADHEGHADHEHGHADHEHGHADHEHGHSDHEHGHEHRHGILRQIFRPHGHDAADATDAALEASVQGIRALKISLVGLAVTAALQAVVVAFSGSVALLADTIHNFADALTAVPLWVAFALSRRAASRRYTYGYGRAEDLAGIFIVAMIGASAVVAAWESIDRLRNPRDLESIWLVAAAGLIGFVGNELVASYRIRIGRRIASAALVADGLHARTDGLTSLAVVVGAIGVAFGFHLADPVVGLLITVAILVVLRGAARDIYRRLMDAVEPALVTEAEQVLAATPGVVEVEAVRMRWIGHQLHAEAGVTVDHAKSVAEGHDIAEAVRHRLLHTLPKLRDATVHVSPASQDDRDFHAAVAHHFKSDVES